MKKIGAFLDRIFSPEGSLMDFLGRVGDVILLSVLWLVASIPVFTIGAATGALYDGMSRVVSGRESGVFSGFVQSFRKRFGFLTGLWMAALAFGIFLALDLYFYYSLSALGQWKGTVLFALFAAVTAMYLCTMVYLFPYAIRTDKKMPVTIKNAFYISIRHLPLTLLMLVIRGALTVLCLNFSVLLVALPGIAAWADTLCMRRLMKRYAPVAEEEP